MLLFESTLLACLAANEPTEVAKAQCGTPQLTQHLLKTEMTALKAEGLPRQPVVSVSYLWSCRGQNLLAHTCVDPYVLSELSRPAEALETAVNLGAIDAAVTIVVKAVEHLLLTNTDPFIIITIAY